MARRIENNKELEDEGELQTSVRAVEIPFGQLIEAMLDENTPLPPRYLYRLSDIAEEDLALLRKNWQHIPVWRRRALMEDLQMLVEKDTILSFEAVGRLALTDADAKVRFGALETLTANECESTDLVDVYLGMMENDPDLKVRAVAASALGRFVYQGELDTLQADLKQKLEDRLLTIIKESSDAETRCCALESLGYSSREEIPSLIEGAYNSTEPATQTSALVAMGRSGNERWKPQVTSMLNHSNPGIRAEAARAAGELGISEARSNLFDLVEDANQDVSLAALWALSLIGGKGVRKILQERMHDADDEEEIEFLEGAIDNLDFNEGGTDLDIIEIEGGDGEDVFPLRDEVDDDEIDADELFDFDEDDEDDYFDEEDEFDEDEYEEYEDEEDEDLYFDDDDDDDEDLWR